MRGRVGTDRVLFLQSLYVPLIQRIFHSLVVHKMDPYTTRFWTLSVKYVVLSKGPSYVQYIYTQSEGAGREVCAHR